MNKFTQIQRTTAWLLAFLLVVPLVFSGVAGAASGSQASVVTPTNDFNYFAQVYPRLNDSNPVFKTATYEDIAYVFESEGNFAVLIGGAWSEQTQATIGLINEVAKEQGIKTIYNFDTKLDGASLDIADTGNAFAYKYVDLVNKYFKNLSLYDQRTPDNSVSYTKEDGSVVAADKINSPFLFVYNKDHKGEDGKPAPVVAYLNEPKVWEDFLTNGAVDTTKTTAYKEAVREVLGSASNYVTINESDYIKEAFNRNYAGENAGQIIFEETDQDLIYEHVTYHQLRQILEHEGNSVILWGGSWCPNTQAVIKYINDYAASHGSRKVYFFDTKLDGGLKVAEPHNNTGGPRGENPHNTEDLQIRTTDHPYAKLYVDLVNTYLTNIITQNNSAEEPRTIDYTNSAGKVISGDRLQVPYLFVYNKDNKDADGNRAPILGHIELMYSWTNIQPDYSKEGEEFPVGARYQNFAKALDALYSRLEATPSGVQAVKASSKESADGQITGTSAALEYRLLGEVEFTKATGSSITGLTPGTYEIRYAAKPGYQGPTTKDGATAISYAPGQAIQLTIRSGEFVDVATDAWYYPAVEFLTSRNIASGTDNEHFSPNAKLSRGQFVVLLLKAYGIAPEAEGADNFADAGDAYYSGYLAAAKKLGIAGGVGDNRFAPEADLSRQDLLALLHRALEALGKLPAGTVGTASGNLDQYSDADQIADYAKPAFEALLAGGVITGSEGKLNPQQLSTRAQAAQILYNLLSR
ncbi:S-layer homology domain-containing protein [Paenibacillus senegalimassiliensis]|uniref:S-layer homology domain-containing protein n=1 Tax=Paenibacillus senegalimassiliensis TaxID=1737426 RepID=UPI00073F5E29|nr:S-layer homology domain-containing protein [Paenibacillus senegalimassiliensis]